MKKRNWVLAFIVAAISACPVLPAFAQEDVTHEILDSACKDSSVCKAVKKGGAAFDTARDAAKSAMGKAEAIYNAPSRQEPVTEEEVYSRPRAERDVSLAKCLNETSKMPDECRRLWLRPEELPTAPKADPAPMDVAQARDIKDRIHKDDDQILEQLRLSCATPEKATANVEVCRGALHDLNGLEREVARRHEDAKFRQASNTTGIVLRSSALAQTYRMPRTDRGAWDEDYSARTAFPSAIAATKASETALSTSTGAAPSTSMARDISALAIACRQILVKELPAGVPVDEVAADLNALVVNAGFMTADTGRLANQINVWMNNPSPDDLKKIGQHYETCLLMERLKQLNAPNGAILRRTTRTGSTEIQASIDESQQWERDRPAREARAAAEWRAALQRRDEQIANEKRQADLGVARDERDAQSSAVWGQVLGAVADVAQAYVGAQAAQQVPSSPTAGANSGADAKCMGDEALCYEIEHNLAPGSTLSDSRRR